MSSGDGVRGPGMNEVCRVVGNLLETRPASPSRMRVRLLRPLQDDMERVRDGEASGDRVGGVPLWMMTLRRGREVVGGGGGGEQGRSGAGNWRLSGERWGRPEWGRGPRGIFGRASVGNEGAGGLVGDRKVVVTWCR